MNKSLQRSWTLHGDQPLPLGGVETLDILKAVAGGVYEGFRTYDGTRVYRFGAHALRMESGRARLGLGAPIDLAALGRALANVLDKLQAEESHQDWKVRIDHAETDLHELNPNGTPSHMPSHMVVQAWPLTPVPRDVLESGAVCALERELVRERPLIKGTAYSLRRLQHRFAPGENYESILIDSEDNLLEGVMSGLGLFIDGKLRTAGTGVLPSLTVEAACGLASSVGIHVCRETVRRSELNQVQEAFLASSVRGLVPISSIDGVSLGDGRPGKRTMELRSRLAAIEEREARRPDNR